MTEMANSMAGKTCLVTGASRGIGFYTAQALADRGAHVILVGHNLARGQAALARLGQKEGRSVEFMQADLSVQEQVHLLARGVQERVERLDVLVNNAGGFFLQRQESADGIEMTWALNYLAVFLLTGLLLDLLKASAPARIVNIASSTHRGASLHLDDVQLHSGYGGLKAYGQSKLAVVLFTYELARRLEGSGLTANAVHPGYVATDLGKQHWLVRPFLSLAHLLGGAKPPEAGAETPVYVASSPQVEGVNGKYFVDKEPVRSSESSYDLGLAHRVWAIGTEMTAPGDGSMSDER